ncbi:putative helicase [Schistosoma mansoni]|uniref:putative helicase n=1 Tax=Schistosoma mansoni TaxID=6183 RepID=UPI00022DC376|nr:putative helicase [Schistosoma mansoni]|eukprot:XP_018652073.1 putative helicase [Schistosoma mansoni]
MIRSSMVVPTTFSGSYISQICILASSALKTDRWTSWSFVLHTFLDYSSLLKQSGVLNLTRWFDVRGNHDSFGVPSFGGDGDYYSQFGVSGRSSFRSNIFKLVKPYGQYSFISIDLSTEPGLKWPLNFFGSFNLTNDLLHVFLSFRVFYVRNIQRMFIRIDIHVVDKATIHILLGLNFRLIANFSYPSVVNNCVGHGQDSAFAYLCGHLHTLFGLAKKMYFLQPQGYWEWELGDWRENRYFRIVAVDNDLVSFVDVRKFSLNDSNKEWPIILITNPKNANFLLPRKEPFHRIEFSTHIRILVWSLSPILRVSVSIDGIHQGFAEPAKLLESGNSTPLYVLPWNTSQWSANPYSFHVIEVTAKVSERFTRFS